MSEDKLIFLAFEKDKRDREKNGKSVRVTAINIWGDDASYDDHWYSDEIEAAKRIGLVGENNE